MIFSSLSFLFLFLPAFLFAYFISPDRLKNIVLCLFSLIFYYIGATNIVFFLIGLALINHYFSNLIRGTEGEKLRKLYFAVILAVNLCGLIYFKYAYFLTNVAENLFGPSLSGLADTTFSNVVLPIGISFYTFQAISYQADNFRGEVVKPPTFLSFITYLSMFPQLIAGPIVRYSEVEKRISGRQHSLASFQAGIFIFIFGLGKKVLLADQFAIVADAAFGVHPDLLTTLQAWIGAVAFAFQIYFDFLGYSEMAIGLGLCLGFRFPRNFRDPYLSLSITEFWRRWHMTLSRWFRDYLYIPLGGNRVGKARIVLNLFIVFVLCGFWHGASFTFIVWGVYHGIFLALERLGRSASLVIPKSVCYFYSLTVILVGWVLFRSDDLSHFQYFTSSMFAFDFAVLPDQENLRLGPLVVAAFFTAAYLIWIPKSWQSNFVNARKGEMALIILLLSSVFMSTQNFNPFIYFRF